MSDIEFQPNEIPDQARRFHNFGCSVGIGAWAAMLAAACLPALTRGTPLSWLAPAVATGVALLLNAALLVLARIAWRRYGEVWVWVGLNLMLLAIILVAMIGLVM